MVRPSWSSLRVDIVVGCVLYVAIAVGAVVFIVADAALLLSPLCCGCIVELLLLLHGCSIAAF